MSSKWETFSCWQNHITKKVNPLSTYRVGMSQLHYMYHYNYSICKDRARSTVLEQSKGHRHTVHVSQALAKPKFINKEHALSPFLGNILTIHWTLTSCHCHSVFQTPSFLDLYSPLSLLWRGVVAAPVDFVGLFCPLDHHHLGIHPRHPVCVCVCVCACSTVVCVQSKEEASRKSSGDITCS